MANEKSKQKSYVEEVFDGMRTAEKLTNSAENTASGQSITPAPNGFGDGFGTPMMAPQLQFQSQAPAGFQSPMYDFCKSLIPGTTISPYVRCKTAEFVVDNWKLGGLYRIETTDHQCVAFLTKKTPEVLEFLSVDNKGNNITIEIKANDLCSDFKEKRDTYPYACVYNVPTNPIIIYPLSAR